MMMTKNCETLESMEKPAERGLFCVSPLVGMDALPSRGCKCVQRAGCWHAASF